MKEMSKTVVVISSMAAAMILASIVAVLTATPGASKARTVTLVGAGDIAGCEFNQDRKTARLLGKIHGTVFTLGDNVYPGGSRAQFRECYDPTWGKYIKRTRPSLGDEDYKTSGAKPYFDYFGWRAGKPTRGYYSYKRGSWHIVALNSNCKEVGGCDYKSTQGRWLRKDLANHPSRCTLAYFHHPLYATGSGTATAQVKPYWNILYNRSVEVILSGHAHRYERYASIKPNGVVDQQDGIRQFVVGTGGN